ncbi:MAG: zinc-ribbon domain-containing protein [Myxococcota bacterium]|mgnify:CR=1 FL=1
MIVQCTSCGTRFRLDDDKIGPDGARVRCSRCQTSFNVPANAPPSNVLTSGDASFEHGSETRVARVPEAVRRTAPPAPAMTLEQADESSDDLPLADDDFVQEVEEGGSLNLDGTFEAPAPAPPAADAPIAPPMAATLDVETTVGAARRATRRPTHAPGTAPRLTGAGRAVTRPVVLPRRRRLPGVGLLVLLGIVASALYWLRGGPSPRTLPGWQWLTTPEDRTPTAERLAYRQVVPSTMRSLLYPAADGRWLLVFVGEVENRGEVAEEAIDVVVEVADPSGRTLASGRAPLGVSLGPTQLTQVRDVDSLRQIYDARIAELHLASRVAPGGKSRYTAVIVQPPSNLRALIHRVRLVQGTPRVLAPPEPQPTDEATDEAASRLGKAKRKGKLKGKLKARPRKGALVPDAS